MDGKKSLGCTTKTEGPKQINRERLPCCDITDAEKVERLRVLLKRTRERLPWCDITDAEKVERLRVLLKRTQKTIERLEERLYDSEQTANKHQHGADGAVLVRAGRDYGRPMCGTEQCQPGKEWF